MVSMSGDRQRSASTSVVQEVNANKDSPSASTSSTTAAAAANNSIKDKKMASNSSAAPTSHVTSNSSAAACGSNGIVSGPVNSSTRRPTSNAANPAEQAQLHNEESPNHIVYRKVSPPRLACTIYTYAPNLHFRIHWNKSADCLFISPLDGSQNSRPIESEAVLIWDVLVFNFK